MVVSTKKKKFAKSFKSRKSRLKIMKMMKMKGGTTAIKIIMKNNSSLENLKEILELLTKRLFEGVITYIKLTNIEPIDFNKSPKLLYPAYKDEKDEKDAKIKNFNDKKKILKNILDLLPKFLQNNKDVEELYLSNQNLDETIEIMNSLHNNNHNNVKILEIEAINSYNDNINNINKMNISKQNETKKQNKELLYAALCDLLKNNNTITKIFASNNKFNTAQKKIL